MATTVASPVLKRRAAAVAAQHDELRITGSGVHGAGSKTPAGQSSAPPALRTSPRSVVTGVLIDISLDMYSAGTSVLRWQTPFRRRREWCLSTDLREKPTGRRQGNDRQPERLRQPDSIGNRLGPLLNEPLVLHAARHVDTATSPVVDDSLSY
eukprot:4014002-Prymnesium_polylepis.1